MAEIKVTIIGLNRLGTSFGLAIKGLSNTPKANHQFIITGSDQNRDVMKAAREMGAIDNEVRDPDDAVAQANVIILSAAYHEVKDVLEAIGSALKPGAVVLDLSPLKVPSIEWAQQAFPKNSSNQYEAYLVGLTPLINPAYLHDTRETFEAAHSDLFSGGALIVAPAANCPEEAVRLVTELADLLKVPVHFVDPIEHDGLIAAMEGLPLLLQVALFQTLSGSSGWSDMQRLGTLPFVVATYRLGTDLPEDVAAFVTHNRDNVVRTLESLSATLQEITDLVRTGDTETIVHAISDSFDKYARWQHARTKNKWTNDQQVHVPNPGMLGPFGGMFGGKKKGD